MTTAKEAALAKKRARLKEKFGNCCYFCSHDFSDKTEMLEIHHRDFLAYLEFQDRDPFHPKLAVPACVQCHLEAHVAASAITFGLTKSIPAKLILKVLENELGIREHLANCVMSDLARVGISERGIHSANNSIVCRILIHAMFHEYFDELEAILKEATESENLSFTDWMKMRSVR